MMGPDEGVCAVGSPRVSDSRMGREDRLAVAGKVSVIRCIYFIVPRSGSREFRLFKPLAGPSVPRSRAAFGARAGKQDCWTAFRGSRLSR